MVTVQFIIAFVGPVISVSRDTDLGSYGIWFQFYPRQRIVSIGNTL